MANQAYPALVTQENHYDPWGVAIEQEVVADKTKLPSFELRDRFKFLGRESIAEIGWVDLMKRMYDPATGRFTNVDPSPDVAGQESLSTYQYGWNNPLRYPDPNGDCPTCPQQFISWLVGGYYKYIKGGVDYARNKAQHNTRSEYTERVPEQTRNINYAVGKAKAIQTSVEGATQIVESHMTMIGLLEGGAIAAAPTVARTLAGVKHLDFFGGATSRYSNALNIDVSESKGFKGTIDQFTELAEKQGLGGSFKQITANNPQADFLSNAGTLLQEGGTITVRGTMSNKFFNKVVSGKVAGYGDFEVVQSAKEVANSGYKRTDGGNIQGTIYEMILRKK